MPAGTETAASPLRAWGTSQHRRPCYGFFLPYLIDGINLLRCTKSVLPFIAFQCLAQHLTQYLLALSKDLLNKELGQHPGGLSRPVLPEAATAAPGSLLSPQLECVCVWGSVCVPEHFCLGPCAFCECVYVPTCTHCV